MNPGTLAQTALPQVLLEKECKCRAKKLEWHERATSRTKPTDRFILEGQALFRSHSNSHY